LDKLIKIKGLKMAIWKLLLTPLELYIPECIKRITLRRLTTLCAVSFQRPVPQLTGLSADELLKNFALFTESVIKERLSQSTDLSLLKDRLYRNAFQVGQLIRGKFGLVDRNEVIRLMRCLYRIINIDLKSDSNVDGIIISKCFFSSYYSSEICRVMAAFDQGLAAGLSGGEHLEFCERITDGYEFCRAYWHVK
jgi:hypothetical protein